MHSSNMSHFPYNLSQEQEQLARDLSNDYSYLDLSLDDMCALIADHPNLSKAQLCKLLDCYLDVIKSNPRLVQQYGALAVFQEFISLSAYDPGHGGNYTNRKPSVEIELEKGMEEAIAELGVMEIGKVSWPLMPSTDSKYESTDRSGQKWDVKAPRSTTPKGKPNFDAAKEAVKMQKDFNLGENIIIDDRNITPKERRELYKQLKARRNDGKVVWWPFTP